MKPKRVWIAVTDGAQGKVLLHEGPASGLQPVTGIGALEGDRRPTREQGSDRPGRSFESADGSRHAYAPRADWHEQSKEEFAREMASVLNDGQARGAFDSLILVAPPKTLGVLRKSLDKATAANVRHELAKDLTNVPDHDLAGHLDDLLVS